MPRTYTTHALRSLSLADLKAHLGSKWSRPLAHNTRVEWVPGGDVAVRFHATRILTFHPDGSFTVNTGGYQTVTTKQRLNALMPAGYHIHQKAYRWYISTPEGTFPYEDGDRWEAPAECPCSCHPYQAQHGRNVGSYCTGCGCKGWTPADCTTTHGKYLWCGPSCYVPAPFAATGEVA